MQHHGFDVLTPGAIPLALNTALDWEPENRSAREAARDLAWKRRPADANWAPVDCCRRLA